MARPDKAASVAEIAESFRTSSAAVLTEYRGLTVAQLKTLRRSLGSTTSYAVVKNTLSKIAAKQAGVDGIDDLLAGPTAIAFVQGDPVEAAKGLRDFAKAHPHLVVKGGYMDGRALTPAEIATLADLESREVLLAKLAGAMNASLAGAVSLFAAPLSKTARLIEALRAKAEQDPSVIGGAGEPVPTPSTAHADDTAEAAPAAEDTPEAAPAAEDITEAAPAVEEAPEAEATAAAEPGAEG